MSKTYKHIGYDDILNVSSRSGSPVDRMGNALTPANLNYEQDGDVLAARFNGDTSLIDCGDIDPLIGDKTFLVWFKLYGFGQNNLGLILHNSKLFIFVNISNRRVYLSSDGITAIYNASNSLDLNKWYNLIVTRTSVGIANFYLYGVLSGAANQNSGTPVAGTTNIIIGEKGDDHTRNFDGLIEPVIIKPRILTAAEIQQYYTATRKSYENH